MSWAWPHRIWPYPPEKGVKFRILTMPTGTPERNEPPPQVKKRKTPGKADCAQCQAAGGFCSEHIGYFEEYDILRSIAFGGPRRASLSREDSVPWYPQ